MAVNYKLKVAALIINGEFVRETQISYIYIIRRYYSVAAALHAVTTLSYNYSQGWFDCKLYLIPKNYVSLL